MRGSLHDIGHHPAEDMLWDYYRGALKPGLGLVVRSHLDLCPHCRGDIALFDAIGGAMLDKAEGVAMADNALDLALARIERPETPVVAPVKAPRKAPAFLDGVELPYPRPLLGRAGCLVGARRSTRRRP